MRHGLRVVRFALGVCAAVLAFAVPAQAYVYWAVGGPGFGGGGTAIGRANLDGSGITHSLVTGAGNPGDPILDGSHIYWLNGSTASIARANLDGSGADPTWITPPVAPAAIAVDATHIYWTDGTQYIGRANLDGTGINAHYIPTTPGNNPTGIAVDSGTIYFGALGQIMSVPTTGGTPTAIGALPPNTSAITMAVAGGYLYWSSVDFGDPPPAAAISRIQLAPAHTEDLGYIPNLWLPEGVATDGTYLYWTDNEPGHLSIGRALIGSFGATNIQNAWITEPGGPTGVAVDARIDPTQASLACSSSVLAPGSPTTCTATVTDTASTAAPTGTVNVTGNGAAFFSGNPCTLSVSGSSSATCVVGAVPTTAGSQAFQAAYSGDPVHSASAGSFTICAGTTTQCGSTGPTPGQTQPPSPQPTPKPNCVVPKLTGKPLTSAKTALRRAHCALGKVKRPRVKKGHKLGKLVVGSQSPKAGRKLAGGSKVGVVLISSPRPHKRR